VTQLAVGRPFGELHLGHQRRLDPVRRLEPHARGLVDERGLRHLQRVELLAQVARHALGEAGAHLAREAQAAVFVDAEEQRAQARALALGLGKATDHELLLGERADLQPARPPAV
jgi:hypothetical protein